MNAIYDDRTALRTRGAVVLPPARNNRKARFLSGRRLMRGGGARYFASVRPKIMPNPNGLGDDVAELLTFMGTRTQGEYLDG